MENAETRKMHVLRNYWGKPDLVFLKTGLQRQDGTWWRLGEQEGDSSGGWRIDHLRAARIIIWSQKTG